jgi:pheromone shutdown protein TraB
MQYSFSLIFFFALITLFGSCFGFTPSIIQPLYGVSSRAAYTYEYSPFSLRTRKTALATRTGILQSSTSITVDDDDSTVSTLTSPSGQIITLIGTAHLSRKSNEQVQRLIEEIEPNVVMVELDPSRLHRIGIASVDDIQLQVANSEDIVLPKSYLDNDDGIPWFLRPVFVFQEVVSEAFSRIARALLTGMYKDMSDKMNNKEGGGGEFLVAIRAAENCTACVKLVLGDRSSLKTIKRAAELAIKSGDPLGVLDRLQQANGEEMQQLEERVRKEVVAEKGGNDVVVDESEIQIAMMETLKEDSQFRDRLFRKLEQEVPEFTQAFLKERDYIMAEAIRRELASPDVQRVVGVVGLAHVPGMQENLRAMFSNEKVPLEELVAESKR